MFFDGLYYNVNTLGAYNGFYAQNYSSMVPIYKATGLPILGVDYPPTGDVAADLRSLLPISIQPKVGFRPSIRIQPLAYRKIQIS